MHRYKEILHSMEHPSGCCVGGLSGRRDFTGWFLMGAHIEHGFGSRGPC